VKRQSWETLKSKMWLLLWLLIFGLTLAWRAQNLAAFGLSNDEGAYLMWAQLPVEGYPLYQETRAVQPPFFLEGLALALRLGGPHLAVGRWAMLSGYLLLAVVLSKLAWRSDGKLGAVLAVLFLGLAPLSFTFSRLVMAEVPATGVAALALLLFFRFFDGGSAGWLVASGLALGVSLLIKPLNPIIAGPVAGLLLWQAYQFRPARAWRALSFNSLSWSGGLLLPFLFVGLAYDRSAMYDQLIAFRGDLRAAIPGSWADTWAQFQLFFAAHWSFWLLAGAGLALALGRWPRFTTTGARGGRFYPLLWGGWLLAGLAMLAWHSPLFPHHFVILLPPLFLLGVGFVRRVVSLWQQPRPRPGPALALALPLVLATFGLPQMVAANQKTAAIVTGGREAEALQLLAAVTAPTDFLMGDSQLLIFMAGRRTPPPLGDVALVAIKAGYQTSARMIELNQAYATSAVVQWSLRLPWLPEYLEWVDANYLARRVWDNDHIIYFAPRFPAGRPLPNGQRVRLGDSLLLRGFALAQSTWPAGETLWLRVYWQSESPPAENYTVFTQLLDGQGRLVAGWDSQPLGGYFPTGQWPAGEIVGDVVPLPLPAGLPAGTYRLITGLYRLETGERLATPAGVDFIELTTVTITN
jgi:4-amino-4-deoxy-L-arabinose transferase-like glycosyltransferase